MRLSLEEREIELVKTKRRLGRRRGFLLCSPPASILRRRSTVDETTSKGEGQRPWFTEARIRQHQPKQREPGQTNRKIDCRWRVCERCKCCRKNWADGLMSRLWSLLVTAIAKGGEKAEAASEASKHFSPSRTTPIRHYTDPSPSP